MLWYVTQDIKYIVDEGRSNVLLLPKSDDEIIDRIRSLKKDEWKEFSVINTLEPSEQFKNLFVVKELENQEDFLTSQELHHNVSFEDALFQRLGMEIRIPKITYADMKGFEEVIEEIKTIEEMAKNDGLFALKPIYLLGMAGTGKSRVVEAYAGEHSIPLIDLNIPAIAESRNPIQTLHKNFREITKFGKKGKICIRIDEFEQMSAYKELLGVMLTILNDLNKGGYLLNGMMFFTSNSIDELTVKIPQFFRMGRFSLQLFISFPKKANFLSVMQYFNNQHKLNLSEKDLERIFLEIEDEYKDTNFVWTEGRSPYVAGEADALFSLLNNKKIKNYDEYKEVIKSAIKTVKPLLVTAKIGVEKMYQKAIEQEFKAI